MSDHTISSLPLATRKLFQRWLRDFKKQNENPAVEETVARLTQAGCDKYELQWALFYAAMSQESAIEAPEPIRQFFAILNDVLRTTVGLKTALEALLDIPMGTGTVLGCYLAQFAAPERQMAFILRAPPALLTLYRILGPIEHAKGTIRKYGPAAASRAETLLFLYATKASSRKPSIGDVSILLEAACQAYGIDVRKFGEAAVAKRLGRFKREASFEVRELRAIIDGFLRERSRGSAVNLIPYYYHSYSLWLQELTAELVRQGHWK